MHAAQPDWEKSGNIIRSAQVRDRVPVVYPQPAANSYRLATEYNTLILAPI
jgi:hypothetical protein